MIGMKGESCISQFVSYAVTQNYGMMNCWTWEVFKALITNQFSDDSGYGRLFKEAVLYTSTPNQDLQTYSLKAGNNRLN